MENGVLCLVVPKRERGEVKRGRRIPVMHGNVSIFPEHFISMSG
jgi:hypothetical protein